GCSAFSSYTPPFQPSPGPYPAGSDAQSPIMSFPIAASSIVVGIFFGGTSGCPATVQLTSKMVSQLFGGDITAWNSSTLRAGGLNPGLATCNLFVRRVVRSDSAGTTQILKDYLKNVDGTRSGALCSPGTSWTTLAQQVNNTAWPTGAGCSSLVSASGDPALLDKCTGVNGQGVSPGSVCY